MSKATLLAPEERVLPTLEADGSRRWLYPRLAKGHWWKARRVVAWGLIGFLTVVPFISINGNPAARLDLAGRKLYLLGQVFLPRDTFLLALLAVSFVLVVFLTTALLGRAWCGWTCPQTVYLEFVYRPIERLFMGNKGVGGKYKNVAAWRYAGMYAAFLAVSLFVAHTLLSYFVGVAELRVWMTQSPLDHPWSFAIMAAATGGMMFNFSFFREQTCLIACPYGRFQSVLLDRNSLVVKYDVKRGEPRRGLPIVKEGAAKQGDCVGCTMCVQVCPTGIDIRDGLQFECVNCTQCIDACDAVMEKVGKPKGLIRYSSQNVAEGFGQRFLRPRVVVYAAAIVVLLSSLTYLVATKSSVDVLVVRNQGLPFVMAPDGRVEGTVRVQVTNRLDRVQRVSVALVDEPEVEIAEGDHPVEIEAGGSVQYPVHLLARRGMFEGTGKHTVTVRVSTEDGRKIDRPVQLFGPAGHEEREEHGHEDGKEKK